jgi:SAM-dependent methyltransferase
VDLGFGGEVAGYYARFRRGYPGEFVAGVLAGLGVGGGEVVLDLGCGTGQLTLPLAARVRAVIGMDPEPDMLAVARRSAADAGVGNVAWVLGADTDVPGLGALLGPRALAAVTIGQALHWMRPEALFAALRPLLRPGGGVAVISNGAPLWRLDTDWSRRLQAVLERRSGRRPTAACGTDEAARRSYRDTLRATGFTDIRESIVDYAVELTAEQVVGGLYSAMGGDQLPAPADRPAFAGSVRAALGADTVTEPVRVVAILARTPLP